MNAREEKAVAVFIGWQEDFDGGAFPLFNVKIPTGWTTVREATARQLGFAIPKYPDRGAWEAGRTREKKGI